MLFFSSQERLSTPFSFSSDGVATLQVELFSENGLPFDSWIYIFDDPSSTTSVAEFQTTDGEGETQLTPNRTYVILVWDAWHNPSHFYVKKLFLPSEGAKLTFTTTNDTAGEIVAYCHDASGALTHGDIGVGVDLWTLEPKAGRYFIASNTRDSPDFIHITPMTFHPIIEVRSQEPEWLWNFYSSQNVTVTAGESIELHAGGPTTVLLENRKIGIVGNEFNPYDVIYLFFGVLDNYGNWLDYVAESNKVHEPRLVITEPDGRVALNVSILWARISYACAYFQPTQVGQHNCTVTWDTGPLQGLIRKTTLFNVTRSFLQTDLNKDGTVNIQDLTIVAVAYGSRPGQVKRNETADFDKNGMVNIVDISKVAKDYGKTV